MNLSELVSNLAERLGIQADKIKDIIDNPALSQATLPDDVVSAFKANFLTIKEAQKNLQLKKHYAGVHLGSMDSMINDLFDEYSIPDEVQASIKAETNTFEKVKLFSKHLASLKDEAAKSAGGDKAKLAEQISSLNAEIVKLKDAAKAEVQQVNQSWESRLTNKIIDGHFGAYQYAMEHIPADIQSKTARMIFEEKLKEKGGRIKYTEDGIKLVSSQDETLDFTIDHKPVQFKDFADSVMAENKLLKLKSNDPTPSPRPAPTPGNTPIKAPAALNAIDKALADFGEK